MKKRTDHVEVASGAVGEAGNVAGHDRAPELSRILPDDLGEVRSDGISRIVVGSFVIPHLNPLTDVVVAAAHQLFHRSAVGSQRPAWAGNRLTERFSPNGPTAPCLQVEMSHCIRCSDDVTYECRN